MRSPSGRMVASPATMACQSLERSGLPPKNASALVRSMPSSPLRSLMPPWVSMMCWITTRRLSSSVVFAVITPSPLKRIAAINLLRSTTSSRLIVVISSGLPSRIRIRRASSASDEPNWPLSSIEASASVSPPCISSSGSRSCSQAQRHAAISSGGRIRPSLSVSIKSSVRGSISMPRVGHASATQSF